MGMDKDNIFVVTGLVSKEWVTIFPGGYRIYNVPLLFQWSFTKSCPCCISCKKKLDVQHPWVISLHQTVWQSWSSSEGEPEIVLCQTEWTNCTGEHNSGHIYWIFFLQIQMEREDLAIAIVHCSCIAFPLKCAMHLQSKYGDGNHQHFEIVHLSRKTICDSFNHLCAISP